MKKSMLSISLIACLTLIGGAVHAQSQYAVGGHLMLGGAGIAEHFEDTDLFGTGDTDMEFRARFAGGIGGFFNLYITDMIALYGGLEILGKGGRYKEGDVTLKIYTRHMDFPLGVMASIQGFHAGGALVPSITLSGKTKIKSEDAAGNSSEVEQDFNDDMWDNIQRFNIGLRLFAGYAIPVGPIAIVPGLMWQMDLLNATKGDAKDADIRLRSVNFMLTAGVEYGF